MTNVEVVAPELLYEFITRSTVDVFTTMLGLEVDVIATGQSDSNPEAEHGVVAFIGFAGDWIGTGRVACGPELACKVADALWGHVHTAVEEGVLDAVGEMTNMILGGVKNSLEDQLGPMLLSIPTVIYGRNFTTRSLGKQVWHRVVIGCAGDRMEIKLALRQEEHSERHRAGIQKSYSFHI